MILFQFHITMKDFPWEQKEAFRKLCEAQGVKPLLIELSHGDYVRQPMFTKLAEADTFPAAKKMVDNCIAAFQDAGYEVAREKAEVAPENALIFSQLPDCGFQPYYEWHCKVQATNLEQAREICAACKGHLSRNALDRDKRERYVTLREFGSEEEFQRGVGHLLNALRAGGIPIVKQKFEYCIYDSSPRLDSGWAS